MTCILALAYRLGTGVPPWIIRLAESIYELPVMDYHGSPSPPSFLYTDRTGRLAVGTGPGQQPDPSCGWWSSLCVGLWKTTGSTSWLERATKFGPTHANDEQARKFSMLYRGAVA